MIFFQIWLCVFIWDSCFSYWIYHVKCIFNRVRVMVFNTTFNTISFISWRSVLLMEETWVPREDHWTAGSHWQTLSHNVVSSTPRLSRFELTSLVVMGTDCICSYKSNYHTIMTVPIFNNTYFFFKKERKIRVIFFLCKGMWYIGFDIFILNC